MPPTAPTRRPERAEDRAFRLALFCESRPPHERFQDFEPALADRLLHHQFAGQEASYRTAHPDAHRDIVEVDGIPVGRIVVDAGAEAWTIVDVAIMTAWRGRGIGTRIIAWVMGEAQAAGVPVRLRVMATNQDAMRLYGRLGFVPVAASEIDLEMAWHPFSAAGPPLPRPHEERFPDRLRLPLDFDAAAMAADLERLQGADWIAHFRPQNHVGDWSVIPLRCRAGTTDPKQMIGSAPTADATQDTPVVAACPAIRAALAQFRCRLQAARLMRLGPGSLIKEHIDCDLSFDQGQVRLHVPITTNPEVDFRLNGRRVAMAPGETWYLRLADPHSVANRGPTARVHLVVDAEVNAWVEGVFEAAARG